MLRKHRVLFVMDPDQLDSPLETYKQFFSSKPDYRVYTCKNVLSEVCLEIVKRDPDTVFFSTDFFDNVDSLKIFISTIESLGKELLFIDIHSYDDYDISDYINKVVNVYSVNVLSNMRYPMYIIEKVSAQMSYGVEDFEKDLNEYVYDMVKGFKCQRFRTGSHYVTQSILFMLMKDNKYMTFNKDVYPYLMKKNDVSLESIDNAMRRFVNAAWDNISPKFKNHYFVEYVMNDNKPTAQEFVYEIADHIYVEHRKEFCKYYINRSN